MFKFYLLAAGAGLTLATYHHYPTLFPHLQLNLPPLLQQYRNKWFPVQKVETIEKSVAKNVVQDYMEISKSGNKLTFYSKLHKRPLAVHQLITKNDFVQTNHQVPIKQENLNPSGVGINSDLKQLELSQKSSTVSSVKSEIDQEVNETKSSKNQTLYKNFFNSYAQQLISAQLCESVELISGPVYSKDTPYKIKKEGQQKKEAVNNVYVSYLKMSPNGEYLTDRFYTIVVCNSKNQAKYVNGFTMRRSYAYETFKLTNYLTSLNRLQEQTGLVFNLQGKPLTLVDYKGINKDRLYSQFEPKQEQK